ncbi:MAG: UvrB/UvrC motif-containing protein [Pirellulaceae bacterium]
MDEHLDPTRPVEATFAGFDASPGLFRGSATETLDLQDERPQVRQTLRARCPRLPGVYGMLDERAELIYVGMSSRLRDRLLTYFTRGRPEAKEQRIASRARRLVWEIGDHEFTAQLRELELIRQWRPRFNARHRPGRHEIGYVYLAAGAAPNLRAGRRIAASTRFCWGPLPLSRRIRAAVSQLNHIFRLRDCPDRTPIRYAEQMTLFPHDAHPVCLRGELGTCLAPCSGDRRQEDYTQSVSAARALLDGRDPTLIQHYETAMQEAATRRDFELAAAYRDTWKQLSLLNDQLQLLRGAQRDFWFVYPISRERAEGTRRASKWMVIAGGTVVAVLPEPRSRGAARRCLELLESTFENRHCTAPEDYYQIRLVTAWFRRHPQERERAWGPDQAQAICRARGQR